MAQENIGEPLFIERVIGNEHPGFDVIELKNGAVLCIDDDGGLRVGIYRDQKSFAEGEAFLVRTEDA